MRRIFVWVSFAAALIWTAMAGGCAGHDGAAADASADSYGILPGADGGNGEGDSGDTSTADETSIRLMHASPDLGPIDFCWRPSGAASFNGPVLGGGHSPTDAAAPASDAGDAWAPVNGDSGMEAGREGGGDAGTEDAADNEDATVEGGDSGASAPWDANTSDAAAPGSLVFGKMTATLVLPTAGTFDIAVVTAGQSSCVSRRIVGTVTLDASKRSTVVLMGQSALDAGPDALTIVAFTDSPLDAETARVRIIHAALGSPDESPAPVLSVRAGSVVLAGEVDPQKASAASTSPAVDALGYTTVQALTPPTGLALAAVGDAAVTAWAVAPVDLGVQLGSSHTGIIVSLEQGLLGVAWCADANTAGGAPACSLWPATP